MEGAVLGLEPLDRFPEQHPARLFEPRQAALPLRRAGVRMVTDHSSFHLGKRCRRGKFLRLEGLEGADGLGRPAPNRGG